MRVTPAQYRVLSTIQELSEEQGYVPSYPQIAAVLGVSTQAVHKHVEALVERGIVRKVYGMPNSLEVIEGAR